MSSSLILQRKSELNSVIGPRASAQSTRARPTLKFCFSSAGSSCFWPSAQPVPTNCLQLTTNVHTVYTCAGQEGGCLLLAQLDPISHVTGQRAGLVSLTYTTSVQHEVLGHGHTMPSESVQRTRGMSPEQNIVEEM